ncbi:mitogen-activated protein kinase kinase kinase 1a-like [Apis dorsata]|uniref:mitogen-activated protein kinase kinase kinase 1a-like n=1 Tax=Apis dorsata TaxID=7462 RepID=UPI001293EA3C|nr:mitogen-activated protein kinase kinase kinase 1a-like [Apis dorsata]
MTVNRSVITIVLILVTFVIVLVHMKDVTTLEYDNLLLANETNAKHRVHTESSIGDHRQGRMSLQAELPSSKAKREQALRSILAARRRQIFSQRPISESRNLNRAPRPFDASAKDASIDVLEAQETRHGMYVTAAAGKPGDEEASGGIDGGEATSSRDVDIEFVSRDEELGKRIVEQSSTGKTGNVDRSIGDKSSLSYPPPTTSLSSLVPNQKSSDTETRGKNTVPMPESLYNYFRPVESNIPVEDMSQFLYFGQKIQPEIQNGTGNNNDTAESTASAANSRRRYSMKRNFGATTTVQPVARLEEMINEEMNIAVERQTVEKNKVSKMKHAFRGAENGVYYRKARPAEATIASNVIGTGNGTTGGSDPAVENKFRDDNPSAHVDPLRRERGMAAAAAAHVAVETWNASNSTQIPAGQPVSAITRERNGAESEIKLKDRPTDASNKSKPVSSTVNGVNEKPSKVYPRKRKSNDPSYLEDEIAFSNPRESLEVEGTEKEGRGIDETTTGNGSGNRTRHRTVYHHPILPEYNTSVYSSELNRTLFETGLISVSPRESVNISEVISKRHDGDAIASQETVAVVSYILATLVVFPIAVGVGLILRRLILRNRKVLEESDTSSEISCRKDALNLENGDFKTSIEKAITKLPRIQHLCHEAEKPPPPSSQESRWEFPRDKLRLQTVLGQGNFGQVWKAEADDLTGHQGTTRLVAVKTVKEGASEREKEDLVRELEIMQQLGSHPNVVTLLGCCTEQEPHYLILEYVMYGKLLAYLRDHRTRQDFYNFSEDSAALTSRDLTVFGYCVARGMEYLASKKIIHRDLAARNVLVDHNKLCKIADFGMSRFADGDGEVIETRHGRNALPIRWMAPESLIYSLFTTKTDVWSFGILMWEIVTLGSTPYPDMTAREVMRNVQNGYRLERPSHCRSELFRVISRCWHADPDRRPEFQTLRRDLAQLLEDNMNGHYVDLESFASECTD